jgi:lipopolysaccharide transport system ATP-binding protein
MSDIAIRVENLSKRYEIGAAKRRHDTLRDQIADGLKTVFSRNGQPRQLKESIWALKDISFEIKHGEVVGFIGRNGAGKSTLLKILSRITAPTAGHAEVRGRVGSLLEVGTGFHGELTGRENIYLNGAILGMKKAEIDRNFDAIVAFAEIDKFLDTPVKHYSSGMYVRLAFAVAAHLEPEILIVDEVLAVGDAAFQKKCLGKMGQVATEGRTILFVSHSMQTIASLCETAIWLESGCTKLLGPAHSVIQHYSAMTAKHLSDYTDLSGLPRRADLGKSLRIMSIESSPAILRHGESVTLRVRFEARKTLEDVTIGVGFSTAEGTRLLTYETDFQEGYRPRVFEGQEMCVELKIDRLPLAPGIYALDVGSRSGDSFPLDYLPTFGLVEIIPGEETPAYLIRPGAGVRLPADCFWRREKMLRRTNC